MMTCFTPAASRSDQMHFIDGVDDDISASRRRR